MAARPDILLQGRVPDVGATFRNALLNVQGVRGLQQKQAQAEREAQLQPLRQRLLESQVTTAEQGVQTPQQQLNVRDKAKLDSIANFARQNLDLVAEGPNQNLPLFARRLAQRRGELVEANLPTTETDQGFQLLEQNPQALASELSRSIQAQDALSGREQKAAQPFTLSQGQQRFGPGGEPIAEVAPKTEAFTLAPGEQRIVGGKVVATGAPLPTPVIPPQLLSGLTPKVAEKGSAAFSAAGGGKDGVKAFTSVIDKASEQERRAASPQIIRSNFPTATPAELQQLQATMDAAKTTETGLKKAEKVRIDQRQRKKAKTFQVKAVSLLTGILGNPQLGDVLGSIEGAIDIRLFSDDESELIADIDEAGNILTADNLDLMTGVLSESDIKLLKTIASGALNRKRTEKRFINDVTELRDKLSATQVTTIDDQQADGQADDVNQKRARLEELRARARQ